QQRVAGPLFAPAESGRDAAVGDPGTVHVRHGPQVRYVRSAEHFGAVRCPTTAGRKEEGVDRLAGPGENLSLAALDRLPRLGRLRPDAAIDLVGHGGLQVE